MELHLQESTLSESEWLDKLEKMLTGNDSSAYVCQLLFCGNDLEVLWPYWEKSPVHFRNLSSDSSDSLNVLFSRSTLISTCDSQLIPHGNNVNVVKFSSGVRTTKEYPFDTSINPEEIKKLFKKGYTLQFFQPQRFSDGMHAVCAGLERVFGTLAGASAYLTPPRAQGLAPHWDDVEVFIIQTEGKKLWHLWKPMSRLSEVHSGDLSRSTLGAPDVEITLRPGDVLYLPRGTIHEAISLDCFSTHVTASVYQKYNIKSLIEKMMPNLLEKLFDRCNGQFADAAFLDVRRGLPIQMASMLGTYAALNAQQETVQLPLISQQTALPPGYISTTPPITAAEWRNGFTQYVAAAVAELGKCVTTDDIDKAADFYGEDFCSHRLPEPRASALPTDDSHCGVAIEDAAAFTNALKKCRRMGGHCNVRLCHPTWLHVAVEDVDGVRVVLLGSGKHNSRMNHMGHPPIDDGSDDSECGDGGSSRSDGSECEGSELEGSENDWVKTSLPFRAHGLVRLLSKGYADTELDGPVNGFVDYDKLLEEMGPSFEEEEVVGFLMNLHRFGLLEFHFTGGDERTSDNSGRKIGKSKKRYHNDESVKSPPPESIRKKMREKNRGD